MKALAISIFMMVCAAGSVASGETNVNDIKIPEMKEIKMNIDKPNFNIKDIEIKEPKIEMKEIEEINIKKVDGKVGKIKIDNFPKMPKMDIPDLSNYDFGFPEDYDFEFNK